MKDKKWITEYNEFKYCQDCLRGRDKWDASMGRSVCAWCGGTLVKGVGRLEVVVKRKHWWSYPDTTYTFISKAEE